MELLTIGLLGILLGSGAALGINKLLKPKQQEQVDVDRLLSIQQEDFKKNQELVQERFNAKEEQFKKDFQAKEEKILKDVQEKEKVYKEALAKEEALVAEVRKHEAKEEALQITLNDLKAREERLSKEYNEAFKELEKQQATLGERFSQIQHALQNASFEELSAISSSSFGMLAMQVEQLKNAIKSGGYEGASEMEVRMEGMINEFRKEKMALADVKETLDALVEEFETEKKFIRRKEDEFETNTLRVEKMITALTDDLKNGKPFNINDVEVSELRIKLNALIEDFKVEKESTSDNLKMLFRGLNTLVGAKAVARDKSY
jgi:chromosome segregation ATPase